MKLWHRFPNLYLIGSLSLLSPVGLSHPTLAIAEISKRAVHKEVLTIEHELPKEISPTSKNIEDAFEQVEQSELYRVGEAKSCRLQDASAS